MPLILRHPRLDEIHIWWADQLGCAADDLYRPATTCITDPALRANVLRIFRRGDSVLLRMHPAHEETVRHALGRTAPLMPIATEELRQRLALPEAAVVPLQRISYLDPWNFEPADQPETERLSPADAPAINELAESCTRLEVHLADVRAEHPVVYGSRANGTLVSAASFLFEDDLIADAGVLTHPQFRNHGYGRAAVSALCRWGLQHERVIQYCALCTNQPSLRIADALGFSEYAVEESIRLQ
jgi:RimJ/RimL family protein N-acetyltransferase